MSFGLRTCAICGKAFTGGPTAKYCVECRKARTKIYHKEYYLKNSDEIKSHNRKWWKSYYSENKEHIKSKKRENYRVAKIKRIEKLEKLEKENAYLNQVIVSVLNIMASFPESVSHDAMMEIQALIDDYREHE